MSRGLIVALIVTFAGLVVPLSVAAELTNAEKYSVVKIHAAIVEIEGGLGAVAKAIRATSDGNRNGIADVWLRLARAHRDLQYATILLVGANPEVGAAHGLLIALPRIEWVHRAWDRLDSAVDRLDEVERALPALSKRVEEADRHRWLYAAVYARRRLVEVDRSLPFDDPRPRSYPQIIGPHGHYDLATNQTAQALLAFDGALDEARIAYPLDSRLPDYTAPSNLLLALTQAVGKSRRFLLNVALIPLDAEQCAMNPFQLVATGFGPVTSNESHAPGGAPYFFRTGLELQFTMLGDIFTRPLMRDHYVRALVLFVRAWSSLNGAVWRALEFPDRATLEQLRTQGFAASSPFAAPLCGTGS